MKDKITQEEYCNDMAVCFSLFTNILNFFLEEITDKIEDNEKRRMLSEVIGSMHHMWTEKSLMGKDASKGSKVAQHTIDEMFQEIAKDCELITDKQIIRFEHKNTEDGHTTTVMIGTPKDKDDNIPTHINNDLGATA